MAGTTHIIGYRTAQALQQGAAQYQALGYRTVQIGPTADVLVRRPAAADDWPSAEGQSWYVLIATEDVATDWSGGQP